MCRARCTWQTSPGWKAGCEGSGRGLRVTRRVVCISVKVARIGALAGYSTEDILHHASSGARVHMAEEALSPLCLWHIKEQCPHNSFGRPVLAIHTFVL